jgi:hypothetical protein
MERGVIIGGMQRSGTSLVRELIGSNSQVELYPFDALFIRKIYTKYGRSILSKRDLESAADYLFNLEKVKISDKVSENPRKDKVLHEIKDKRAATFLDVLKCFLELYSLEREGSVWGFKTPRNEFWANDLLLKWENVKFIHVIRDPRDVFSSLKKYNNININFSLNPIIHKSAELVDREVKVWRNEWVESFRKGMVNKKRHENRYKIVKYEDIIKEPKVEAKKLCNFIGIEYEKDMMRLNDHPGWEGNNSSFKKGKRGIHQSSLSKYRKRLSNSEIYYVEETTLSNIKSEYFTYIEKPKLAQELLFVIYKLNDLISYTLISLKSTVNYLIKVLNSK